MLSWRTRPKDPTIPPNSSNMGWNPPPPTRPECRRSLPKGTVTRDVSCTPATQGAAPPPRRRAGDGGASPQRNEGITSRVRMDQILAWRCDGEGGGLASPSQEEATEQRKEEDPVWLCDPGLRCNIDDNTVEAPCGCGE
jgi:hypothetical protein